MYKVLIVDDDLLARMGMKTLVDWGQFGYEVIGAADSGEQALEMMAMECPDVVFTDVVMHGMDGVELTRQIKALYPRVLVVALSCYTDVDYVKNILRMGAEDYLQKLSMSPDDLTRMLIALAQKLGSSTGGHGGGATLLKLIHSKPVQDTDPLPLTEGRPYRMLAVRRALGQISAATGLNMAMEKLLGMGVCCARYREDVTAAIVPDAPKAELEALVSEIIRIQPRDNGPLVVGFSPAFTRAADVRDHFFRAGEAALSGYLCGERQVFFYQRGDPALLKAVNDQMELLNRLLEEGDLDGAAAQVPELTRRMKAQSCQATMCRQMDIALFSKLTRLLMDKSTEYTLPAVATEFFANVDQAHQTFLRQLDAFRDLTSRMPERYRREVKLAIGYIKEHFSEDITLSQVAKHVAMSESRLSSVFKKETGKGLINYLEEYRIAQAVKMLSESREPLFVIALRVGYPNVNYFSRVFKKVRGEAPSQFVKRQKNKEDL